MDPITSCFLPFVSPSLEIELTGTLNVLSISSTRYYLDRMGVNAKGRWVDEVSLVVHHSMIILLLQMCLHDVHGGL